MFIVRLFEIGFDGIADKIMGKNAISLVEGFLARKSGLVQSDLRIRIICICVENSGMVICFIF